MQYAILAFVRHSSSPGGPGAYFTTSEGDNAIAHIVDPILFAVLTLVGDSFMVSALCVYYNSAAYYREFLADVPNVRGLGEEDMVYRPPRSASWRDDM